MTISPKITLAAKHFGKLALLGAGVAVVIGLIGLIGSINIAAIPATYAVFAAMLIPLATSALKQAETELEAELAAEQAHKDIMAATNAATAAQKQVLELTAKLATPSA